MIRPEEALPGRSESMPVAATHPVLGTPMVGPWPEGHETIYLAMGCFWGADRIMWQIPGVYSTACGYMGGWTPNPTYEEVCTGRTGHAEAVAVTFDPETIPSDVILDVFFTIHDPRQLNRQGNDIGTQYRSAMYYRDEEEKALFEAAMVRAGEMWDGEIVTELSPLGPFYMAEDYHQDFFAKNPTQGYCLAVAVPKVNKVRQSYQRYLRTQ